MRVSNRGSILNTAPETGWTPVQEQVDTAVGGFVRQATDWRSLTAMTAGGLAYRAGRIGAMGLGSGNLVRTASVGLGLTAEVSAFELTNRGLSTAFRRGGPMWPPAIGSRTGHPHGGAPTDHFEANLWKWSGPNGLRQGLLQSLITFGTLKGAGHFARAENLLVQHLFQDTVMVAGHQATGALGMGPHPTGSLAEQLLHAEATNLQISAGMSLAHGLAPGIHALEKGLALMIPSPLSLSLKGEGGAFDSAQGRLRPGEGELIRRFHPVFATAGPREEGKGPRLLAVKITEDPVSPIVTVSGSAQGPKNALETYRALFEELKRSDFQDFRQLFRILRQLEEENQPIDFNSIVESIWLVSETSAAKIQDPSTFQNHKKRLQEMMEKGLMRGFAALPIYNAILSSDGPRELEDLIDRMNHPEVAPFILKVEFCRIAAASEHLKSQSTMGKILDELNGAGKVFQGAGLLSPELASAYLNMASNPRFAGKSNIRKVFKGLFFTVFPGVGVYLSQEVMGKLLSLKGFRMKDYRDELMKFVQELIDPSLRLQFLGTLASDPRIPASELLWIGREIMAQGPQEPPDSKSGAFLQFQELASMRVGALGELGSNPNTANPALLIAKIETTPIPAIAKAGALIRISANPNLQEAEDFHAILKGIFQVKNPEALSEILKVFLTRRQMPDGILEEVWGQLALYHPRLLQGLVLYRRSLKASN